MGVRSCATKRCIKRIGAIGALVVLLSVVAICLTLWHIGRGGTSALEAWVGDQIQLVATTCLNPKLTFEDLDYEFPATIRVKGLRLTASDPDHPGQTIDILGAQTAEIELAEIPHVGQPIHIETIRLKDPLFQVVAKSGTNRLIGFSNLLKPPPTPDAPKEDYDPAAPAASSQPAAPVRELRMSDFIRMRRVELVGGRIVFDPRRAGTPPMELDHISTTLDVAPTAQGCYGIHTHIKRDPIFDLGIAGNLDLDNLMVTEVALELKAQLGRDNDAYLPPQMQKLLREHDVKGALQAKLTGWIPLRNLNSGQLQCSGTLAGANATFGDLRIPIDAMAVTGSLEQGKFMISSLRAKALRGEATLNGSIVMNDALNSDLGLTIRDMRLDDTIRPNSAAARDPKYGGRLNAKLAIAAPLRDLARTLKGQPAAVLPVQWGSGRIDLDQARLVHTPLVQDLMRTFDRGRSFVTGQTTMPSKPEDRATIVFTLGGDQAHCSDLRYESNVFAVRGRGAVGLNRELDLQLNAGPLEKMQSMTGRVGAAFGRLTDAIASYHVTGAIGEPRIEVEFAGGTVNRMGRSVGSGFNKMRDGIEDLGGRIAGAGG